MRAANDKNRFSSYKSAQLWKDSSVLAMALVGGVSSVMGVIGVSFADVLPAMNWQSRLALFALAFAATTAAVSWVKVLIAKRGITLRIREMAVHIKQGDLFAAEGWRVIPFNEYFDTIVDDVVISRSSLNGKLITDHIENLEHFQQALSDDADEIRTNMKRSERGGRWVYPLGRIKTYEDYMLLAFTHFDSENRAHLTKSDYETCLRAMWREINRTYAGKPIFLPLLGSGITRFDDEPHKSNFDLLKCMVCPLRASGASFNQPISILLTEQILQEIDLYALKGAL